MAAPASATVMWSQYLGARLADMCLALFPVEANLRTAGALGRLLYRYDRRHRLRTFRHLAIAFPEADPRWRQQLALKSFEHFVRLVVEICASPRLLHMDSWPYRVRFGTLGPMLERLNAGQAAILVTGHLGNWEILGTLMAILGYPAHAVFRPIDNPLINDWLLGIRQKHGLQLITKWNATDRMIQVLRQGGTLGFIADQNAGDKGLFVPFFGKLASTLKSIGLLAMNQNVPIICGYAHRIGRGFHYEVGIDDIIQPQDWARRRDPLYYLTARYMRSIESMVRRRPEQYLWMHRRWKSRPRHEREGKPLSPVLRRRLEELPWMDQATLDRLAQAPTTRLPRSGE